jgi:hypothetical protein
VRYAVEPGTSLITFKNCSKRYTRKPTGIRDFTTEDVIFFNENEK